MDNHKRILLKTHQNDIVKDLDVKDIFDELYSKKALSRSVYDRLYNLTNREDRTRYLVDILIQSGDNAFYEAFVDSLSKDYRWLWEKFTIESIMEPVLNESFEDSLSLGDVPRLPEHYVQRTLQENEVARRLRELKRHTILVLHGMSGCGKTVIATGVLRNQPKLITESFGGVVFWLNLSDCRTTDDIVALQTKLYRRASMAYGRRDSAHLNLSVSMSSIGSNTDNQSFSSVDLSWEEYLDTLKNKFLEPGLKEALVVLDEVNDRKCLEAFNIGCKLLVTTRDTSVVTEFEKEILTIDNSFKESESLQLFASCLEIDVSKLPRQAKKIHDICKGGPFQIGLIGAQLTENKERLVHDSNYWNFYLDKLVKRDFYNFFRTDHSNPMKPIEMCIKSLPKNTLHLFKQLAVLPNGARISSKVLDVLWRKHESEVEAILKELRSKALIARNYIQDLREYQYEVHDLIMTCLRGFFTPDEMSMLHLELLKSYGYGEDNSSVELVDDGYFGLYIGYHIFCTENLDNCWRLFNRLYLDLRFLGNKIRLTGPADVITDLQRYHDKICINDMDRDLKQGIDDYLGAHGNDLYRYPCTDIVQSILQHVGTGALFRKAHELAQAGSAKKEVYFDFIHEKNVEEIKSVTIDVKEVVCTVSFLGKYVLVGTKTGMIKVFFIHTNELVHEVKISSHPIKWVAASPNSMVKIAALSEEGLISVWCLDLDHATMDDNIEEETNGEVDSCDNCDLNKSITLIPGQNINCRWANNTDLLLAHTIKKVTMYTTDGEVLTVFDNWENNCEISCCTLASDDASMIMGSLVNNAYFVDVISMKTKDKIMSFNQTSPITQIFSVPGSTNRVLVLTEREVLEYSWHMPIYPLANHNSCKSQTIITSNVIKENLVFISAVVNKGGSLLFVSTNDSRIICVDLKTNAYIFDLNNRRGNVTSMDVSVLTDNDEDTMYFEVLDNPDVLLSGTGNVENDVKVWYLDTSTVTMASNKLRKARLTTKFDTSFLAGLSSPQTPSGRTSPPSGSIGFSPKRNNSMLLHKVVEKRSVQKSKSLDRHSLKRLNLKGISNGNEESGFQPLLAVVDDKNNIRIMRGKRVLTEISEKADDSITMIQISPCNLYVIYGLKSGNVKKYTMSTRETEKILAVTGAVEYLCFVNPNLLVVSGRKSCLMAYKLLPTGDWKLQMLQLGNTHLGSQELLNDFKGARRNKSFSDTQSNSGSETSSGSLHTDRAFPGTDSKHLCKGSSLVACFWIEDEGMITIEVNARVKLWDLDLKVVAILNVPQSDVFIRCAAFQKNILALCDDFGLFQTFQLREHEDGKLILTTIQKYKLNNKITSCDLTKNGHILAMGLDSGNVVIWNIKSKYQVALLKHHKSVVQSCLFSPVPARGNSGGSVAQSPVGLYPPTGTSEDSFSDGTPLVLVTMGTEIVWWNISYVMRLKQRLIKQRNTRNVLTPKSPIENRIDPNALSVQNLSLNLNQNQFFGSQGAVESWETIWKSKTYKPGSKMKEILACVKLSGVCAKKLLVDDKFSCFVTVDNPGCVHIMNMMKNNEDL